MSDDRLVTIDEFMRMLGVRGRSTFLLYERTIPNFPRRYYPSPAKPRFRLSEVVAFVDALPERRPAA